MILRYDFASDNTSGICPEAWAAMQEANSGFAASYGTDSCTDRACTLFRELFETDCEVFFVFNGTAANSLSLASLCQSYHSVISHEFAHIETDECGAPEFFSNGTKLLLGSGPDGRLTPDTVQALITKRADIHYPRPRVLSVSQPTELGTLYRPEQIKELSALARSHGLKVHMDGARFAHALSAQNFSPAELTWRSGVDVLCFGGTKAGIGLSEAVIFFDRALAEGFDYRCKQSGQLASKMRYLAAPWLAMLKDSTFSRYSRETLRLTRLLGQELQGISGVQILHPIEANSVFVKLSTEANEHLQSKGWRYYQFIGGGARFMCSWQTKEDEVRELAADVREATSSGIYP